MDDDFLLSCVMVWRIFWETKVFIVYRRVINLVMNLLHFVVVEDSASPPPQNIYKVFLHR